METLRNLLTHPITLWSLCVIGALVIALFINEAIKFFKETAKKWNDDGEI